MKETEDSRLNRTEHWRGLIVHADFVQGDAGWCRRPVRTSSKEPKPAHYLPSHRKVIHIILSQNTLCKRLFIHIRELLAPTNTICMCKRAKFNMYRVVVSAYLYIFENSWPNRILYVCLYFRWRCIDGQNRTRLQIARSALRSAHTVLLGWGHGQPLHYVPSQVPLVPFPP